MLASLATIMKEKTALVTSMVYFALTLWKIHTVGQWYLFYGAHSSSSARIRISSFISSFVASLTTGLLLYRSAPQSGQRSGNDSASKQ